MWPGPMMPFARESSFNVGDKSNEEARQMLKNKRKGTFLVRYSSKHKKYFINSNNKVLYYTNRNQGSQWSLKQLGFFQNIFCFRSHLLPKLNVKKFKDTLCFSFHQERDFLAQI